MRGSADPTLREAGILIRPHPRRLEEWQEVDLTEFKNVALFGSHPVDPATKNDYFDSLHYAAAVVGLNTSAMLEAAVVGKPVLSVVLPEISTDNQEGTIHFHYLLEVGGGLLILARSLEEHVAQLSATLADPRPGMERARRFTEAFIRPQGLDQSVDAACSPTAIESAATRAGAGAGRNAAGCAGRASAPPALAGVRAAPGRDAAHGARRRATRYRRFRRHAKKQVCS